jgi:hypothetical protein
MPRHGLFDSLTPMEALDLRLSPTSLSVGALVPPSAVFFMSSADDPVPDPEPAPCPLPGESPPTGNPELPPSGPVGPGTQV